MAAEMGGLATRTFIGRSTLLGEDGMGGLVAGPAARPGVRSRRGGVRPRGAVQLEGRQGARAARARAPGAPSCPRKRGLGGHDPHGGERARGGGAGRESTPRGRHGPLRRGAGPPAPDAAAVRAGPGGVHGAGDRGVRAGPLARPGLHLGGQRAGGRVPRRGQEGDRRWRGGRAVGGQRHRAVREGHGPRLQISVARGRQAGLR